MCAVPRLMFSAEAAGATASPPGVNTTAWVLPKTAWVVLTVVLIAIAAVCCTAVAMSASAADTGDGLDSLVLEAVTPALSKSCDWVAEEEEKGLASSEVAGVAVLGVSPKPVPELEEDVDGLMGTS